MRPMNRWTGAATAVLLTIGTPSFALNNVGGSLGSFDQGCSGGCVDVYKVTCADTATHQIRARVRSLFQSADSFEVVLVGYTGPATLLARADRDASPVPGGFDFSPDVLLTRAPGSSGATKALVQIGQVSGDAPLNGSYELQAACFDAQGVDLDRGTGSGRPRFTILQDE